MEIVWTILLWILKVLGYLIGGLLLLVLILLLIILILPIRYQIDLTKKDAFLYGGSVTYFVKVLYHHTDTENILEIKFLGFTIKKTVTPIEKEDSNQDLSDLEQDLWETDWQNIEEEEFKRKLFKYLENEKKARLDEKYETEQEVNSTEDINLNINRENQNKDRDRSQYQTIGEWIEQNNDSLDFTEINSPISSKQEKSSSGLDSQQENTLEKNMPCQAKSEQLNSLDGEKNSLENDQNTYNEWDDYWFEDSENNRDIVLPLTDQSPDVKQSNKQKYEETKAKVERVWKLFKEIRIYLAENKGVIKHIFYWLFRMLKSILPKRMDGHLNFGLSDPANTGYVLAIFYLFYPENRGKITIDADFDKSVFAGKVQIKGRIILIVLLYYLLRIVIDRRIIRLIKLVLKIKKEFNTSNNENKNKDDLDNGTYASAEA